jgi:hypothetical protein
MPFRVGGKVIARSYGAVLDVIPYIVLYSLWIN